MTHPNAAAPAGDWLFQHDGMLYGPVPGQLLFDKIESGTIGPDTPVARDGEPFRRIGDEPAFAVQVARAAARIRVETQAREQARRRKRRRIAWLASMAVAALLLAGGAVRLVLWAEGAGLFAPDEEALAALQIQVSLPTFRVEPVGAAAQEELLDYLEPEGEAAGGKSGARAAAGKRRTGRQGATATVAAPERDGLVVEASYDQAAIQTVLAREQRTLYPCLQEQARNEPSFRGEVPLSFTIDNAGRVGRIWIDRAGVENGPLFRCFQKKMAAWRFPGFRGERPSISLSFRVGS
ncbi:AgmX/PglI C-terminal domain-containing protein [Vulgatibacter sp.]|uniref:AgmX/PglI C-terminal domain-containing protein n=1 Tax=Vulgatibacter sp. TaxID=1971226 RepID=UPI0035664F6A